MLEASMFDRNCVVTLTYDDDHLPAKGSIDPEAPVLWMKRLREKFGEGIRSFGCAEYGCEGCNDPDCKHTMRPHYHVCLFNFDFDDRKFLKRTPAGSALYTSDSLAALWTEGHSSVGDLTFESAAYVARYVTKKVGSKKNSTRIRIDRETGEVSPVLHEQPVCVSRMPGLGARWFEKHWQDVYPADQIVIKRGEEYVSMRPPKYFDRLLEEMNPELFKTVRRRRRRKARELARVPDGYVIDQGRLRISINPVFVKETIQLTRFKLLKRGYESAA